MKTSSDIVGTIENGVPEPGVAKLVVETLGDHLYHLVGNETNTKESRVEGER